MFFLVETPKKNKSFNTINKYIGDVSDVFICNVYVQLWSWDLKNIYCKLFCCGDCPLTESLG